MLQLVEQEYSDVLDSAMFAASSWVANAPPTDVLRMRNFEIVESALTKDAEPESSADAVRAGMASKAVSVRPACSPCLLPLPAPCSIVNL